MPRKNARPAAKKRAARLKARKQSKVKGGRYIGRIAEPEMAMQGVMIAALASATARSFDMTRDAEIDRIIEDNLDDLYEP